MRYKNRKISEKTIAVIFFLIFVLLTACLVVHISVTKHYEEISEREGTKVSAYVISSCIEDIINSENADNDPLVKITYDENGGITSLEADPVSINRIQSRILKEVNAALSDNEEFHVKMPLGTLTGNSFLSGRGPKIDLMFDQKGSASVSLENQFVSGGINQTVHRIFAHVEAEIYSVSPFESKPINFTFDYLISETVIVGNIPESYFSLT